MENQETGVEINKLCRLCLTQENTMSSIFNEDESSIIPLPLRIMACVSVEIQPTDCLPSHICGTCLCQVDGWLKFKDLCETADSVMKQFLQNEPITVERISQVQEMAKQWKQQYSCNKSDDENKRTPKCKTSSNEDGKLYSYLKFGVKREEIKMERFEETSESENEEEDRLGDNCYEDADDDDDDYVDEGSSDDSLIPLVRLKNKNYKCKKKVKVNNVKKKIKKQIEGDVKREARTICTQTGSDNNYDTREVIVTIVEDIDDDKKKNKSIKTQTPREKCGGKKRVRVRPAVPSACNLCDKIYKNSEILRQHMKSHHVTGTIECTICKQTFTSLRSLKYHQQRKHSNLEPVPCSFCGKNFLDKKYLRIHENIHSQNNQYVCQFCGRKFMMKTNLTVHISRHHSLKTNDFICQVCGKAFPFKLYLKKHFKTHTDYKPHACTYCDAKFREKTLLRKHVNSIHLKLRPFLCHYCNKTFTRGLYLREHMESQHLGIQKKIECVRCGENFLNRNRLRLHECEGRLEVQL